MPAERKRVGPKKEALPCIVKVRAELAKFLYRERLKGDFRDETELVNDIIRRWTEALDPMDWPAVVKDLEKEKK